MVSIKNLTAICSTDIILIDSSQVDFRNPAAFHHDIASVTTLLKHFLRDLPDPLLTSANYTSLINSAKIDDDVGRRDSLHAIINSLPDPNYATLRVLTLHLHRVAEHSQQNKMTPANLARCFGPTLMGHQGHIGGPGVGGDIEDAGWQARVVETILNNTFQIFDDDD
jgi:Rho GTPase-activating protein RGD1